MWHPPSICIFPPSSCKSTVIKNLQSLPFRNDKLKYCDFHLIGRVKKCAICLPVFHPFTFYSSVFCPTAIRWHRFCTLHFGHCSHLTNESLTPARTVVVKICEDDFILKMEEEDALFSRKWRKGLTWHLALKWYLLALQFISHLGTHRACKMEFSMGEGRDQITHPRKMKRGINLLVTHPPAVRPGVPIAALNGSHKSSLAKVKEHHRPCSYGSHNV